MRLEFFEEAAAEVEESRRWYRGRSGSAESGFLRELDQAVARVAGAPHRWPRYIDETHRYVLPSYPYSLIYFVESDVVHVVAVAHEKRKPGYWRERLR